MLATLMVCAVLLMVIEAAVLLEFGLQPAPVALALPFVALVYIGTGCFAWDRRPSNSTGMLLVIAGLAMLAASLFNSSIPFLASIGAITATVFLAVICQLFLSFPSSPPPRSARWLVIAAYANALLLQAPQYLFSGPELAHGALSIADRPDLVRLGSLVQSFVGTATYIACLLSALRRPAGLDPARRRVIKRLAVVWTAALAVLPITANVLAPLFGWSSAALYLSQVGSLLVIPVAFTAAAVAGAFGRMRGIEEFAMMETSAESSPAQLEARLRGALGDKSARIWFRSQESGRYVDGSGLPYEPVDVPCRGRAAVTVGDRQVGLIEYDSSLLPDPAPVWTAASLIAVEADRHRLTAELRAQQAALAASRARLAVVADAERRRIARDLHDSVQGRMLVAALRVGEIDADQPAQARRVAEVRDLIDTASNHLRWVVAGVMPWQLTERGLFEALEDLVDQLPIPAELTLPESRRLPSLVESTAYFAVAEALTNVIKHARATRVTIHAAITHNRLTIDIEDDGVGGAELGAGSGLIGIVDRLDVLGGGLTIRTRPGGGTWLSLELPCVW